MEWVKYLTIFALLLVLYLYNKGRKDAYKEPFNGTVIKYIPTRLHEEDETGHTEMFMENDHVDPHLVDMSIMDDHLDEVFQENDYIDEFSPENLKIDETLKIINLRKKLKDIDLDYSREDGK